MDHKIEAEGISNTKVCLEIC